ncbi:MAG: nitrate transporter substrate-binding protein, partial [Rubritepida sp.]|nr:nitrate transporter substrate-binding protein [Rubritepida sp.]
MRGYSRNERLTSGAVLDQSEGRRIAEALGSQSASQRTTRDEDGQLRVFGQYDFGIIRDYIVEMNRYREFPLADIPVDSYFTNRFVE